jgi:hypothetical protein
MREHVDARLWTYFVYRSLRGYDPYRQEKISSFGSEDLVSRV